MLLLIFEGLLIGCLLGLTGAGGGILAVPVPQRRLHRRFAAIVGL